MQKIRILQVIGKMHRAGAETLIMNLYRNIDRDKVQFDFVVHTTERQDYDDEIEKLGGKIYHAPQYKIYNSIEYKKWWKNFFKDHNEYKLIHGHIRSSAPIYLKVAKEYGLYTVVHSHNTREKGIYGSLYSFLTRNIPKYADYFFGCSTQSVIDGFGKKVYESNNWSLIKNGVVPEDYIYSKDISDKYKKELNIEDKFVIGHVGRLTEQKNHKFLIDIFEKVLEKNKDSVLLLVGKGELEEKIRNYISSKGIDDNVKFLGVREDVNKLLMCFDSFVFPSFYEGLSVVGIEAQATGIRCFVSEAFTDEGILSDNVYKLSLKDSPEKWADLIIKEGQNYDRKDFSEIIKEKGFDIVKTAKEVEKFYIEKEKK